MAEIYTTQPKIHRSEVNSVDTGDPADISGAVDCRGYAQCRFDLTIDGVEVTNLEVQILFWNPRQQLWWGGGKRTFVTTGRHALVVDCRGGVIFLKVTGFNGTSFTLTTDYALS